MFTVIEECYLTLSMWNYLQNINEWIKCVGALGARRGCHWAWIVWALTFMLAFGLVQHCFIMCGCGCIFPLVNCDANFDSPISVECRQVLDHDVNVYVNFFSFLSNTKLTKNQTNTKLPHDATLYCSTAFVDAPNFITRPPLCCAKQSWPRHSSLSTFTHIVVILCPPNIFSFDLIIQPQNERLIWLRRTFCIKHAFAKLRWHLVTCHPYSYI